MIVDHGTYTYDTKTGLYAMADGSFKSRDKAEVTAHVWMQPLEMLEKPTPLPAGVADPNLNNEALWKRYKIGQLVPRAIELVNLAKFLPNVAIVMIRPPVRQVTYAPPEFGVLFEEGFVAVAYMLDNAIGSYVKQLAAYHTEYRAVAEAVKALYDEAVGGGVTVDYYRLAWERAK